ncbi:MAG: hypothetical protein M9904_14025 [Chitinophagaceae bacterium]|nr:hypothetical protein [Chitinophagaceae bacterium]MCO5241164.1 hypothetical protein [Chitinophagaceae bacterium]
MSETLNYTAPGEIPVIQQPYNMACWATVTTMVMSWNNKQSFSIETAMDSLGSDFRKIFDDNTGLAADRMNDLAHATGMQIEYQRCETPESILQMLQSYGPLIVIDDEDNSANFAVHARIVTGIQGNGDISDTFLDIIDPWTGTTYQESFETFTSKFESMADAEEWNIQIMHY